MNETKDTKEIESTHQLDKLSIGDVSGQSELLKVFYHYVDMNWAYGMLTNKVDEVIDGFKKTFNSH